MTTFTATMATHFAFNFASAFTFQFFFRRTERSSTAFRKLIFPSMRFYVLLSEFNQLRAAFRISLFKKRAEFLSASIDDLLVQD